MLPELAAPVGPAPALSGPPLVWGTLTRHTAGASPGQPRLLESGAVPPSRPLARATTVLPELDVDVARRPLVRQPAFLVSVGLAVAAVATTAGVLVHQSMTAEPTVVEAASLRSFDDNLLLQWRGPDESYSVILLDDDGGGAMDISVYVRGREAWIPRDLDGLTERSCFLVRSYDADGERVSVDADVLAAQGAQLVCLAEADQG